MPGIPFNAVLSIKLALIYAAGTWLGAQQPIDTLRLNTAVGIALENNPGLLAMRLRADAASERISPAGTLPDPLLSFGMRNWPLDLGTDVQMSMHSISLTQRFPWPGKLRFAQERTERLSSASTFDADEVERDLIARLKGIYYRIGFTDRALNTMDDTRQLLRDFHQVSTALYGVGEGLQQDVLQAQIAVASMTESITILQQDRMATVARFNSLMGRPATTEVLAVEFPDATPTTPPADSLIEIASGVRPALRAAHERVLAAEAGYDAALKNVFPDLTVTLGYGNRPQFSNLATVMVGISLPIWTGSRQRPIQREMLALRNAEEARSLDIYNETYARLVELSAETVRARNLTDLYRSSILPQARAAVESALSAYRVGEVDYMTLVQNEMTVNRYEIEMFRLLAEYHSAVAQIEALAGPVIGDIQ